ncbi:MAG TPA: LLM class flavin-dependent oxidoreductase [Rubrobacteraceae bacterium]|nr:LLM class flavin-dependent oxidoreductase [Rubrobacteraceae bacterium]
MHHGIVIANLGDYYDPRVAVKLARTAEEAGWEGFFVWDHLGFVWGAPSGDPWIILSAVAASTQRLKIGTAVTPLARRRIQVVANGLATLDLLSSGRVIFGAGLGGVPREFAAFGDPGDVKERAARLDEGLTVLDRLMSGEEVTHNGRHYTVEGIRLAPLPVQRPRVPVWIGGEAGPALRRAARWDGWLASATPLDGSISMSKSPEQIGEMVAEIQRYRTSDAPFDVALDGYSEPEDDTLPRAYAESGATWWLESIHGRRGTVDEMLARVKAGPPGNK